LPDAIAGVVHNAPALDNQWIETTSKKAALKLEKLDTDLKNYKSNSIKESIRYGTLWVLDFHSCRHLLSFYRSLLQTIIGREKGVDIGKARDMERC
jgi:hypothetical protein